MDNGKSSGSLKTQETLRAAAKYHPKDPHKSVTASQRKASQHQGDGTSAPKNNIDDIDIGPNKEKHGTSHVTLGFDSAYVTMPSTITMITTVARTPLDDLTKEAQSSPTPKLQNASKRFATKKSSPRLVVARKCYSTKQCATRRISTGHAKDQHFWSNKDLITEELFRHHLEANNLHKTINKKETKILLGLSNTLLERMLNGLGKQNKRFGHIFTFRQLEDALRRLDLLDMFYGRYSLLLVFAHIFSSSEYLQAKGILIPSNGKHDTKLEDFQQQWPIKSFLHPSHV